MAETVTPPGKARIVPCPECKGVAGRRCHECQGTGWHVMRACPLCSDVGWDYINGTDDRDGMACRINCGYTWTADDPGWRAQMLPARSPDCPSVCYLTGRLAYQHAVPAR